MTSLTDTRFVTEMQFAHAYDLTRTAGEMTDTELARRPRLSNGERHALRDVVRTGVGGRISPHQNRRAWKAIQRHCDY